MARKIALALLALVALYLGAGLLVRFLASDETKIRWLVEEMEEAYNTGRPGTCVGPLAKDWRHEGYALDRETLLGGLFQAARERERETRRLLSKVELVPETLAIEVAGERATLGVEARFSRLRAGAWQPGWHIRVEAELEDGERGWEIVRSRHADLEGTQLSR